RQEWRELPTVMPGLLCPLQRPKKPPSAVGTHPNTHTHTHTHPNTHTHTHTHILRHTKTTRHTHITLLQTEMQIWVTTSLRTQTLKYVDRHNRKCRHTHTETHTQNLPAQT